FPPHVREGDEGRAASALARTIERGPGPVPERVDHRGYYARRVVIFLCLLRSCARDIGNSRRVRSCSACRGRNPFLLAPVRQLMISVVRRIKNLVRVDKKAVAWSAVGLIAAGAAMGAGMGYWLNSLTHRIARDDLRTSIAVSS